MKRKEVVRRLLATAVAVAMVVSPCAAFADEQSEQSSGEGTGQKAEEQEELPEITEVRLTDSTYQYQKVEKGERFNLPDILEGRIGGYEYVDVKVDHWVDSSGQRADSTGSYAVGRYSFTPVLEEGVRLAEGVELPCVSVDVTLILTSVSGKNISPEKKAGYTLTDTVKVTEGAGRKFYLQKYVGNEWKTVKTYTLTDSHTQSVKITYPSDWWKEGQQKWRMKIYSKGSYREYTSATITTTPQWRYQMPSKYYQLSEGVVLGESGGYTLYKGYMGFKTRMVNSYFGIGDRNWPRYTAQTKACVKEFQKKHGINATGNCGKKTWLKIGEVQKSETGKTSFTEYNWYHKGAYVHPCVIDMSYTRSECVKAFIDTAYEYLGNPYVVGAAGKPGQGCDCSGLVMQACYSCGIDLSPTSVVRHAKPAYEYESRMLYKSDKLQKVSFKNRKKGDLIFYKRSNGVINHVAIYLGNNRIIHSWPNKVQVGSVYDGGIVAGVRRVFSE